MVRTKPNLRLLEVPGPKFTDDLKTILGLATVLRLILRQKSTSPFRCLKTTGLKILRYVMR